jgi:hypothetical protein
MDAEDVHKDHFTFFLWLAMFRERMKWKNRYKMASSCIDCCKVVAIHMKSLRESF